MQIIMLVGIVGNITISRGTIDKCYNRGNVSGNEIIGGIAGGLLGSTKTILKNCYNTGEVTGVRTIGGIVGLNQEELKDCYNTGDVSASGSIVGGIVGNNQGKCSNCYNIGNISGTTIRVGGATGQNDNAILKNSYSLEGKSDNVSGGNFNGATMESSSIKSETEMKALAPTLGSAFVEAPENINDGYPILSWQ